MRLFLESKVIFGGAQEKFRVRAWGGVGNRADIKMRNTVVLL